MLVLFVVSARNLKRDLRAPRRSILWIAVAGVLASNGAMLSFIALSQAPVVVISPVVAISPLMTLVLTAIFLRRVERLGKRVVLGSLLVVGGVFLVIIGNQA
jgi:drug/metabolite transporter (DMT)-like permease